RELGGIERRHRRRSAGERRGKGKRVPTQSASEGKPENSPGVQKCDGCSSSTDSRCCRCFLNGAHGKYEAFPQSDARWSSAVSNAFTAAGQHAFQAESRPT
ncbi:unnamed protein product, partial [Sphacelaria rigidula]